MARQIKQKKSGGNGRTGQPRKRRITPEDLLRFVWVADPQLSPDGSRILFTRKHVGEKNEYVTNLWIVDAGGGEPRAFTGGGRDSRGRWSPDGSRITFIGARKRHRPQIFTISADGGEAVALTEFPRGASSRSSGRRTADTWPQNSGHRIPTGLNRQRTSARRTDRATRHDLKKTQT